MFPHKAPAASRSLLRSARSSAAFAHAGSLRASSPRRMCRTWRVAHANHRPPHPAPPHICPPPAGITSALCRGTFKATSASSQGPSQEARIMFQAHFWQWRSHTCRKRQASENIYTQPRNTQRSEALRSPTKSMIVDGAWPPSLWQHGVRPWVEGSKRDALSEWRSATTSSLHCARQHALGDPTGEGILTSGTNANMLMPIASRGRPMWQAQSLNARTSNLRRLGDKRIHVLSAQGDGAGHLRSTAALANACTIWIVTSAFQVRPGSSRWQSMTCSVMRFISSTINSCEVQGQRPCPAAIETNLRPPGPNPR